LEGGSFEVSEDRTLMACRSSVISPHRNPTVSEAKANAYLEQYLLNGSGNMIWLEGIVGEEVTDCHIDGLTRFYDSNTLITLPRNAFYGDDFERLQRATNNSGQPYDILELPAPASEDKWWYINYYIGNDVILLPVHKEDDSSEVASFLSDLYQGRKVVQIDVTNLTDEGGAIHCITQQQPLVTN
jgi:agmatine deiminase